MGKNGTFFKVFHVFCWILVILPVMVVPQHIQRDKVLFFIHLCYPLFLCAIFYINYSWLVSRYFVKRKFSVYFFINALFVITFAVLLRRLGEFMHVREQMLGFFPPHRESLPAMAFCMRFVVKDLFPLALSATMATLLRLSMRYHEAETARREMEIQKTEAELKNLRNQINPHFLLNTLNNIYALISFDRDKAQKAVLSLSAMMRQMLYGGMRNAVSLQTETDFIRNYVDLMRLRINPDVEVDVNISVPSKPDIYIAPFIIISLVENAFKHGISALNKSFVYIRIVSDGEKIECEIKNSNYPKSSSDKSGHGVGLVQVARRLDLAYKDKYEWERGVDEQKQIYYSKITIYDTHLCDNR